MNKKYLEYWLSIEGVKQIISIFEKEKYDICFVGGCVRDSFLGKKNSDIDFALNCDPETSSRILEKNNIKILDYGKKFGTITAVINKKNFEITSLREDKNQKGRSTEVKFVDSWKQDALRRDFTFNAIYVDPSGKIEDFFGGQHDLNLQRVKFIGNIEKRIKEDYLRILRYFRFLGLFRKPNIIEGYLDIILENLPLLQKKVSNDQIRNEILKMFKNEFKINSFYNLDDSKNINNLIKTINHWWIEDNYELGLKKCINKINEIKLD